MPEDDNAAVIFAYQRIGADEYPGSSLRYEQFREQIEKLAEDDFTIAPLPDILHKLKTGAPQPPRTVALTFDGGDPSFLAQALPLLEQNRFPYTLFIATSQTHEKTGAHLGWEDLRRLEKSGLATIGLHSHHYASLSGSTEEAIRGEINSAKADYREALGTEAALFAYPFGEYDETYHRVIEESGFKGAVGQMSGVAYGGSDTYALPRFVMTERYGDAERFEVLARALPLPVSETQPAAGIVGKDRTAFGFTVTEALTEYLDRLTCHVSGEEKLEKTIIGPRVELRLQAPVTVPRLRINCTLPGPQTAPEEPPLSRWTGLLLNIPENRAPSDLPDQEDGGMNDVLLDEDGVSPSAP